MGDLGLIKVVIYGLTFVAISLSALGLQPLWSSWIGQGHDRRMKKAAKRLDSMFIDIPAKKLKFIYILGPLGLGAVGLLLTRNLLVAGVLGILGLVLPPLIINQMEARRLRGFQAQLPDGLMILSTSLKGGLSLLQAIEVLVEEMSPPISQEFGLVLRENAMGVPLSESLERLNDRMRSDDLNLIVTSILVSREVGGDITEIFKELRITLRERSKLQTKVRTLTTQGRLQGIVMGLIPLVFSVIIYLVNPKFVQPLLHTKGGRILLGVAGFLWLVGLLLIRKFGRVEV